MTLRIAFALALAWLLPACDRNSGDAGPSPVATLAATSEFDARLSRKHSGEPLPAFIFADPFGKNLSIASLKGRPTLINLWATWCGPCVAEMPMLDKLAGEKPGGVRVVTISQDAPGAPVSEFMARSGFKHLEPWLDPEGKIDYHYNTGSFPTTVYYDAQGREVWRYVGARDWGDAQTTALLLEGMIR
ncbi:MAG: TlpA disulfide reductase family protein [Novosphingobium sp.]